jgi:hypothetical protein
MPIPVIFEYRTSYVSYFFWHLYRRGHFFIYIYIYIERNNEYINSKELEKKEENYIKVGEKEKRETTFVFYIIH